MWAPATRRQYSREELRYQTDLTDAEWALIEPLMPKPHARGRPRCWSWREILNGIFYVLRGGIAWRLLERVDIQAFDGLANLIQAPFGRGGLGERSSSDVERSPVGSDGAAFAGQTH
ncbi:transposase, partial [Microvirga tunisiensis]|uniref:transposase n=1 Tax=Microvirga tunisiensis TaxID=2108360 RepID=UPI001FCEEA37